MYIYLNLYIYMCISTDIYIYIYICIYIYLYIFIYLFKDRKPKRVILEGNVFSNLAPICPRPSLRRQLQVLTFTPFGEGGLGEGRGEGSAGPSISLWAVSDPSTSQVPLSHPPQPGNTREDRQHRKWNAVHTGGHTPQ